MPTKIFNTENETAILCILLNNPLKVFELTYLKSFMMSSIANELLFTTIQELAAKGSIPDISLITNYLQTNARLLDAGGTTYLEYLKNQAYSVDNLLEFERLLVGSFKAKQLVELGSTLVSLPASNLENIDTVIAEARVRIDNLSLSSGGETTSTFEDVLRAGWNEIKERINNPGTSGIFTCFPDIDFATGGRGRGNLWIEAGRPGMGKSSSICLSMLESAKKGYSSLLFSYEMPKYMLAERWLGIETGIPISDIHLGYLNKEKLQLIDDAIPRIKSLPIYVDNNFSASIPYVTGTIRKFCQLKHLDQVFIDYIQLMAARDQNATNALGQISRAMKLLAIELNISITLASQLNRGVELRGEDKHPMQADLRQSGNLEEDADVIIMYYRDELYKPKDTTMPGVLEHMIVKNRQTGILGSIFSDFDDKTGRITKHG